MAGGIFHLSARGWFTVRKRVLHIVYLIYSDSDVNALVSSCIGATDDNGRAQIVVIALYDLMFVFFLLVWT